MSFLLKRPPTLVRSARPSVRIVETFGIAAGIAKPPTVENPTQLVLDAQKASTVSEGLIWLYQTCHDYASSTAFRSTGGRVVILRSCPDELLLRRQPSAGNAIEAVAASDAMVGFAKSLAKENGPRGATVNLIRDASTSNTAATQSFRQDDTDDDDACRAPLEWLLSHHSCYVTGQELKVIKRARQNGIVSGAMMRGSGAVLITGAAGAIGASTANFFCQQQQQALQSSSSPLKLLLVDDPSTSQALERLAQDIATTSTTSSNAAEHFNNSQLEIKILPVDVTSPHTPLALAQEGIRWGGWERVIHSAGITRDTTLRKMDFESAWNPVLNVNLVSILAMDRALLRSPGALLQDNAENDKTGCSFVYFGSTSGIAGNAGQSNYAASKAALVGYARAMEQTTPAHSFRVASPGFIATKMTAKMPWLLRQVAARLNALGQAGRPDDVAAAVAFLSSPAARGLAPGFHLRVCGLFLGGR